MIYFTFVFYGCSKLLLLFLLVFLIVFIIIIIFLLIFTCYHKHFYFKIKIFFVKPTCCYYLSFFMLLVVDQLSFGKKESTWVLFNMGMVQRFQIDANLFRCAAAAWNDHKGVKEQTNVKKFDWNTAALSYARILASPDGSLSLSIIFVPNSFSNNSHNNHSTQRPILCIS